LAISEVFRKNAVFIGVLKGDDFIPKASGFIVSLSVDQITFMYVVTAEHVIAGLQAKGFEAPCIRVNKSDGGMLAQETKYANWLFHPDPTADVRTDVAIYPYPFPRSQIIYSHVPTDQFVTDKIVEEYDIGVGTEIAIVGLFSSHHGKGRNIPVVRIGNISAMPEEPIKTTYCGFIDGYLIEAHSISGLSGSPVWARVGPFQVDRNSNATNLIGEREYLLGLVHGHFDVSDIEHDVVTDTETGRGINTGIGVVVPAYRIIETLMQDEARDMRDQAIRKIKVAQDDTSDTVL
jgi:hypothetical protein